MDHTPDEWCQLRCGVDVDTRIAVESRGWGLRAFKGGRKGLSEDAGPCLGQRCSVKANLSQVFILLFIGDRREVWVGQDLLFSLPCLFWQVHPTLPP